MICQRCGKLMYFAPFGKRWYHCDLQAMCPVSWPGVVMTYRTATNANQTKSR